MAGRLLFVLLTALLACVACERDVATEAPSSRTGKLVADSALGPVRATLHMDPVEPRFGERVRFVLEVTARDGAAFEPIEFQGRLGHFRIRGTAQEGRAENGRVSYTITAEPEKTGTNIGRVPKIAFRVVRGEGAGTEQELALAPFEVEVAGLPEGQQPDLADLGTALDPVSLPLGHDSDGAIVAALGTAIVIAMLAWWWWRRSRQRARGAIPDLDPRDEAARAFDILRSLGLIEEGRFAEFFVFLTGIVRRYVERTTGIHAPEQTTEEFLREMEGEPSFEPEQRQGLSEFLSASDLVKFAAQVPTDTEVQDAVRSARSFCGLDAHAPEVAA